MTLEQAKELLKKQLKDMSPEEKKKLPEALRLVGNSWGPL